MKTTVTFFLQTDEEVEEEVINVKVQETTVVLQANITEASLTTETSKEENPEFHLKEDRAVPNLESLALKQDWKTTESLKSI